MVIKTQISFTEYLKLLYGLIYRKPIMIVILVIDFVMILWIGGFYTNIFPVPEPEIYQFITLVLISIVQPLAIYYTIRRNYRSSNHLSEVLEIEITRNEIKIHGESFFKEIKWIKIFKIVEHNNWFLIYENTFSAIIIPKKVFNEADLSNFLTILKGIKSAPVELQNTT